MPARPRTTSGREAAARTIAFAARSYPALDPITPGFRDLDPREARLAHAIVRTVLQRWITLEYLLDRHARQPMRRLEPSVRAVLLCGAAQVLFMHRMPVHAIVDESVEIAKRMARGGAGGLVNALLRRVADGVAQVVAGKPWTPAPDAVPVDDGFVKLADAAMPAIKTFDKHLSIATSHPLAMVRRWIELHGDARATEIAQHGVDTPPIIVTGPGAGAGEHLEPHDQPGLFLWTGEHAALLDYLASGDRWVQDPTASRPAARTKGLPVRSIVDYCAGRGTKTRQLASLHPDATIVAADTDPRKLDDLAKLNLPRVTISKPEDVQTQPDLLLLDVPCSNSGVLGRRPEARYRFSAASLESVIRLQRDIIAQSLRLLRPGAVLLYSTCSIEPEENRQQVDWIVAHHGLSVVDEQATLPGGRGPTYHDGGYWALLRR